MHRFSEGKRRKPLNISGLGVFIVFKKGRRDAHKYRALEAFVSILHRHVKFAYASKAAALLSVVRRCGKCSHACTGIRSSGGAVACSHLWAHMCA